MFEVLQDRLKRYPENKSLLKKYWKRDIMIPLIETTTPTYESNIGNCTFTGFALQDCEIGLNAPDPEVYTVHARLFDAVIKDYHKLNPKQDIHHPSSYFGGAADLQSSHLDPDGHFVVTTKIQINRNYEGFGFANILTPEIRYDLEAKSKEALCSLTGDLSGTYYHIEDMSQELKDELEKEHLLFDNTEKLLETNGVYRDWPNFRGMFVADNKSFVVWVNGEDHVKVIAAHSGDNIADVYKVIVNVIKTLERKLRFVKDDRLGYLTYCPSNVGTGLHAVAHIKLPHLSSRKKFGAICDKLNLKAEILQITLTEGEGMLYAVTNKRTIGLTELEVMDEMTSGVQELIRLEKKVAEGKDIDASTSKCVIS